MNKPQFFLSLLLISLIIACVPSKESEQNLSKKSAYDPDKQPIEQAEFLGCGSSFDMQKHLIDFSKDIERKKITYNSEPLSDCSGMFIRLLQSLEKECNQHTFLDPKKTRSSRGIAKWYYDQGNFVMIKDASKIGHLIQAGAVLFFGRSGKKYDQLNIDLLTSSQGIEHVGTVTKVVKDGAGNVVSYEMFHGRSTGKIAQRTNYHDLHPKRKELPPFGNWNQQLVGIAYVVRPKK